MGIIQNLLGRDFIPTSSWVADADVDQIVLDALVGAGYFRSGQKGFQRTPLTEPFDLEALIDGMVEDLNPPSILGAIIVGCQVPPDLGLMAVQIKRMQRYGDVPVKLSSTQLYAPLLKVAEQIQRIYRGAFDLDTFEDFVELAKTVALEIDDNSGSLDMYAMKDVYEDAQNRKVYLRTIIDREINQRRSQ